MFRLRAAGYHGPDLFTDNVVKLIARASGGLTRRINLITDKTLLAAFSENTHTIKTRHVEAALKDSEFSQAAASPASAWRGAWITAAAVGGIAIGAAGYAFLIGQFQRTDPAAVSPPVAKTPATLAVTTPPQEPEMDLLQTRLAATIDWMARQRADAWTIQLLSTGSQNDLRNYLNSIGKSIEINDIFVYRSNAEANALLSVLYGTYDSRVAAERALALLPVQLKSNRPVPRTVRSIRAELKRP
jgi:septal ring-binding cell division protein DamX